MKFFTESIMCANFIHAYGFQSGLFLNNFKFLDYIPPKMSRLVTKPTKWHVRPAKTQISLGIRPV